MCVKLTEIQTIEGGEKDVLHTIVKHEKKLIGCCYIFHKIFGSSQIAFLFVVSSVYKSQKPSHLIIQLIWKLLLNIGDIEPTKNN